VLRASARGAPADADAARNRARALSDRALSSMEVRLSFFEARFTRDLVARQRELLRLRERCRARIAHGFRMMRTVALDVDRRIRRLDPTLEPRAAVFLTMDELGSAVKKSRDDLAPLVRARRADFEGRAREHHPSLVFRGVAPSAHALRRDQPLRGMAASPGSAEGRAVRLGARLEGLDRFAPGDILVVRSLDLGLSPLFLFAGAVVSEIGTALSSSAVVARDCALPLVTSVSGAWSLIRDGQTVRVDADSGTVESFES
jgi:pyruvate,water dikinase